MDLIKQIGPALLNSRIRLEMTRDQVAEAARVSHTTLSALENGHEPSLSLAVVERICNAVGLELALVVRGQAAPLILPKVSKKRVRRSA